MASAAEGSSTLPTGGEGPFREPHRCIFTQPDLKAFHKSQTYADFMVFIRLMSESVRGLPISGPYISSPLVEKIVSMMDTLHGWVDEIPPLQQPMRFGNQAFRQWHGRLVERAPAMLQDILPADKHAALVELLPYLTSGFGHPTRIDYGTGHETSFVLFLYCLFRMQVLQQDDMAASILRVFAAYLRVMRRLQTVYMLEPAGSHGVWGLDDYHCLVFLWGAWQLVGKEDLLTPEGIHSPEVLVEWGGEYLYLSAIAFIRELKKGVPFGESSPMLNDISALPTWNKVITPCKLKLAGLSDSNAGPLVSAGLLRLYEGEVLGKLPVIQHLVFGSLFPCTWVASHPTPSSPPLPPHHTIMETNAPWVEAGEPLPPPPSSVASHSTSGATSSATSRSMAGEATRAPWAK